MKYIKLTVYPEKNELQELSELIAGITGGVETDDPDELKELTLELAPRWDYIDEELLNAPPKRPAVRFYVTDDEDGRRVAARVRELLAGLPGRHELISEDADSADWENKWRDYFMPFPVGKRLYVCPSWREPGEDSAGRKILTIDPGAAFGTGSHATTGMCLEQIGGMDLSGKSVLDAGCGSGILCAAAGLMGAKGGVLCDIDPVAVRSALENLEINGVENMTGVAGDMTQRDIFEAIASRGPFDLTVANITADVLIALKPALVSLTAPGGVLLLSGILNTRAPEVLECYRELALSEKTERDDWVMLKYIKE